MTRASEWTAAAIGLLLFGALLALIWSNLDRRQQAAENGKPADGHEHVWTVQNHLDATGECCLGGATFTCIHCGYVKHKPKYCFGVYECGKHGCGCRASASSSTAPSFPSE